QANWRQQNHITIAPVNLRLKIKIRREPFGLRRKYMSRIVAENKARRRRLAVLVFDAQLDPNGGHYVEEHGRFAAKAKVLVCLADVKANRGLACSSLAAVDEGDSVFGLEPAKGGGHRRPR